jgi:PAS domain S-box-containing protein
MLLKVKNFIRRNLQFKLNRRRRFSTILMTTIVILVTLSVVTILIGLNIYFSKRVELEFQKKLHAQRGQVEILLESRFNNIRQVLRDLSYDNTIRVTVMLGARSQLQERVTRSYPSGNGVYHFVRKEGEKWITPQTYPGISKKLVELAFTSHPQGKVLQEGQNSRLIWLISTPIMHVTEPMATAYALYDLTRDLNLIETIRQTVDGDLTFLTPDSLHCLISKKNLPFEAKDFHGVSANLEFLPIDQNFAISKIPGYEKLFYLSSLENLIGEKRKVTLLLGVFSGLILVISMTTSIFLGRRMVRPLREMTKKAIQISKEHKLLHFDHSNGNYWEFDQMSQAFNFMLTNLKEAEERSRYKELLENVDDAVYILDCKGNILDANVAAYSQIGYPPESFFKLGLVDIVPEKDAKMIIEQLGGETHNRQDRKLTLETCHIEKGGDHIPVEIHSRAIVYQGKPVILNVARDISKRIEVEKALRESEERYRSVVENSNDGIMILGDDLQILYANNELSQILGYSRNELEGSNMRDYLTEESIAPATEILEKREAKAKRLSQDVYYVVCKNSDKRCVKIIANRFKDSSGAEKTVVQVQDITDQLRTEQEKKQLEKQLIHAQKMEALGTLAGGIAHDFNNLLMGIESRVSIMRMKSDSTHPHYRHIMAIEDIVMGAANLTQQLLGFARKGKYQIKPTSLNRLVETSSQMFMRTKKEIKMHTKFQKRIWPVEVDQGQMEQVLVNLYVNAWQAMPNGGDLYVQTQNISLDSNFCEPYEVPAGDYVKVSLTDTGIGMNKQTMGRIFEPFFTTKEGSKGTGLGLASAYGIIKNHKGIIQVDSTEGQGTTFDIYLPASNAQVVEETPRQVDLIKGNGMILIVDDEKESLKAEELLLKEMGYEVLQARSGKEAIEIYRKNMASLKLVTLDVIMPGMSGKDTYVQLKQINPDVKVLLISGYSPNRQVEELIDLGCKGFLQKPFDVFNLSQKISEILEQ